MNYQLSSILENTGIDNIKLIVDSIEERDPDVKYRIRVFTGEVEHIIYREMRQFEVLRNSMKIYFPKVVFPSLVSKLNIFATKEKRFKKLSKFLSFILQLSKAEELDIKSILFEFLANPLMKLPTDEDTNDLVEKAQIRSTKGTLRGFVELKLDEEDWIRYYGSLQGNNIYFFPDENPQTNFSLMICCTGSEIEESDLENVLEIHHTYEKRPILMRVPNIRLWKDKLVVSSSEARSSEDHKFKSTGRLIVKIYSGQNIKLIKPAVSLLKPHAYVSINLESLKYETTILEQDFVMMWNQTFILPMLNRYFVLKLGIYSFSSKGWTKQNKKTDLLEEFSIPLIDVNQYPYTHGPLTLKLSDGSGNKSKSFEGPCINFDVIHEYAFIGNFIAPPSNYIEDGAIPERATLDDFKIISKRLKRIRIVYETFFRNLNTIFTWKYPIVSQTFLAFYIFVALFLPGQLAFPLLIFIFLMFLVVMSPSCNEIRKKFRRKYLTVKNYDPSMRIETIKEYEFGIKKKFESFREKDKDGVFNTLKKIRLDLDELVEILLDVVSIAEKTRSLFLWEDSQKSLYFGFGLLIVIYLLYSVPFRLLVLLIGVAKFISGKKRAKKIHENNIGLCKIVLESVYGQTYLKELNYEIDDPRLWPKDFIKNVGAQEKIVKGIRNQLALNVDTTIFTRCPSPKQLFDTLSSCETLLKLRTPDGHISEKSRKLKRNLISGFIANVPSEYYRFLHPRLENLQSAN